MKKIIGALIALYSAFAFSATTVPVQLLNPTGSTAGQTIVSTGASSAPAWGGVPVGGLAAIAANTVIGNATGSSAIPTAITVTGCNGAAQALQWTNGSGFGCNSAIATSGANSNITGLSGLTSPVTLPGVTNGSAAAAGSVGEYICAQVTNGGSPTGCATNTNTPVTLTTGTAANVTSISLSAGDWRVCAEIAYTANASTLVSQFVGWISTVSAALPGAPNNGAYFVNFPVGTAGTGSQAFQVGCARLLLSSTTTVYLSTQSSFTTSTLVAYGFIAAERRR